MPIYGKILSMPAACNLHHTNILLSHCRLYANLRGSKFCSEAAWLEDFSVNIEKVFLLASFRVFGTKLTS